LCTQTLNVKIVLLCARYTNIYKPRVVLHRYHIFTIRFVSIHEHRHNNNIIPSRHYDAAWRRCSLIYETKVFVSVFASQQGRELAGTVAISFVALYRARNATASLQPINCVYLTYTFSYKTVRTPYASRFEFVLLLATRLITDTALYNKTLYLWCRAARVWVFRRFDGGK